MSNVEPQRVVYDRSAAVRYALRHWNDPNPEYANMDTAGGGGDCSNFTSQCLLAGGAPMDYRRSGYDTEWWYRRVGNEPFDADDTDWWSCTWSLAELQCRYLAANGAELLNLTESPDQARRLRLGDITYYDWDGDGLSTHSAIVTDHNRQGVPLVTYRTLSPLAPQINREYRLTFRGRAARILAVLLPDDVLVHEAQPDWNRLRPCDSTRG